MKFIILILAALMSHTAWSDNWLCVAEHSAGFQFNSLSNSWEATTFRTDGKYLIRRPREGDEEWGRTHAWTVAKFGIDPTLSECEEFNDAGFLRCQGRANLTFDKNTLRFSLIFDIAYFFDTKDGKKGDVVAEIGSCTAL